MQLLSLSCIRVSFLLAITICLSFSSSALAQRSVTNVMTIGRYFHTWDYTTSGGKGRACGYLLVGHFSPWKEYTALSDYVLDVKDSRGRTTRLNWNNSNPDLYEEFKFNIGGTWAVGGIELTDCPQPYDIGGMAPWTATIVVPPPRVSFSYNESGYAPGLVTFFSGAEDPKRKKLELEWNFGDGGSDNFVNPVHQYEKPGEYQVTLKATNPAGAWDIRTNKVIIKAPPLSVSLAFLDRKDANPKIGETVKVRARVKAGKGLGDLSGLRFNGIDALEVPEQFETLEEPESTSIGTLKSGEQKEFIWTLKVAHVGRFTLRTAEVVGTDAANRPVTAQGSLPGEISGLTVQVTFPEKPILLKKKEQQPGELSSDPGYEPGVFPVKVKVSVPTNGEPVKNITLMGFTMSDGGLKMDQVRATGNPAQPWVRVIPQPVPFSLIVTQKPPAATIAGPLAPGDKPVEFDFLVQAERPGSFEFSTIFTAAAVEGVRVLQERGSGIHPVLGDLVLSVQVAIANEPAEIKEGQSVEVYGIVKNLTDNETIKLDPIHIINTGQGLVLGPVPEESAIPEVGSLGVFSPILVPEGDDKEARFKARVLTTRLPGLDQTILVARTNVVLDFAISGVVVDEFGVERELAPENIVMEWGNGSYEVEGTTYLRAKVHPDPIPPRELDPGQFALFLYGNAAERLVSGGYQGIVGVGQFLRSLPSLAWTVGAFGASVVEEESTRYLNSARYLWAYQQWLLAVHSGVSAETKKAELDTIAAELKAYVGRKEESMEKVKNLVNKSVEGFFAGALSNAQKAYDHDYSFNAETADILTAWVEPTAKFATEEIITDLATGMFLARIAKSAKAADEIADAAKKQVDTDTQALDAATADIARQGDAAHPSLVGSTGNLKNLRGGAKATQEHAIRGWAVDKVTDENLIKATDVKNGGMPIVVAVRSRADETLEWMRTKLGMTPKPVTIKQKNVDLIDEQFLGYRSGSSYGDNLGRGGGDRGSVIIAEPLPPGVIQSRIAGLSKEVREDVIKRYRERWEEWYGKGSLPEDKLALPVDDTVRPGSKAYELKFKANKVVAGNGTTTRTTLKGSLPVPKRGSVPDPSINADVTEAIAGQSFEPRQLELRQVIDPPGNEYFGGRDREYYEVWLEDEVGSLRRVAGDVDVVVVADIAGFRLGLNPLKETISEYGNRIARILQHIMKAQHPWSSSLIPDGMRATYMDKHRWHPDPKKRGEPLLLYVNGERRIGWFHPTKAINPENPLADFLFLDGGPGSVDNVVRSQWDERNLLPQPADVAPKFWNTAKTAIRQALIEIDYAKNTTLLATCAVGVGRNALAALYRLSGSNELEKRGPDGKWAKTSPESECGSEGIVVVPETVISENVLAGMLRIPIIEQLLGFDWKQMFRIGDNIVIAPGTPNEETNTIVGHGSLILARPLRFSHPAGTQVALIPPAFNTASLNTQPVLWYRADAGVELDADTNVVRWLDQVSFIPLVNPEGGNDGFPVLIDSDLGLPAVRFNSSDWMMGSLPLTLSNATIFTLSRYNTATSSGNDYIYSIGEPGVSGSMMTMGRRSDNAYHYDGRTQNYPDNVIPGSEWQVFTQVYGEGDPKSHQLFLNGERLQDTKATNPYAANAAHIYLGNYFGGGNYWFVGDVIEWIIFDRALPPAERAEVEHYLQSRAGLLRPAGMQELILTVAPSTTAGKWRFSWSAEAGKEYHLERSSTLEPGSWTTERTITATAAETIELEITQPQGQSVQMFYRLRSN